MATVERFHQFVTVQARGLLALPVELRKRYRLDEPGAQVELTERADGVIELRPQLAVPATQAWFWSDQWQDGERVVDRHVAAGEVQIHADAVAFLEHLEHLEGTEAVEAPKRRSRRRTSTK